MGVDCYGPINAASMILAEPWNAVNQSDVLLASLQSSHAEGFDSHQFF